LGDVVLATPLVRALRRTFPDAYLAALVRPYARDILLHNPHLDAILTDDRDGADRGRRGFWRQVLRLQRQRFDTALLLMPTARAAYLLFCAGIRRRIGVGHKLYEVLTCMQSVSRNGYVPLRHEADYCMDLGRRIGVRSDDLATEVFLAEEERAAARTRRVAAGCTPDTRLIGIHPGHGGSSANWAPAMYAALATRLLERTPGNVRLLLTGEEMDPEMPVTARVLDARGRRPLRDVMADIAGCDVFVSASTGPMHIAAALRVPTVSLFCPLPACSPQLWGASGNRARVLLPPEGFCQGRCPGDPKRCDLREITVDAVTESVLATLEPTR
jgi:heptosyltransferase-2